MKAFFLFGERAMASKGAQGRAEDVGNQEEDRHDRGGAEVRVLVVEHSLMILACGASQNKNLCK